MELKKQKGWIDKSEILPAFDDERYQCRQISANLKVEVLNGNNGLEFKAAGDITDWLTPWDCSENPEYDTTEGIVYKVENLTISFEIEACNNLKIERFILDTDEKTLTIIIS